MQLAFQRKEDLNLKKEKHCQTEKSVTFSQFEVKKVAFTNLCIITTK